MPSWRVYILRCGDGTLYTGVTTDVERRLAEHLRPGGRGARYLRGRAPLQVVLDRRAGTRGLALRLEMRIKKMSRAGKEALIEGAASFDALLAAARPAATSRSRGAGSRRRGGRGGSSCSRSPARRAAP